MMISYKLALALLAGLFLAGCDRSAEVRYRVTVEVNDGGTIRSGSSVWSFTLTKAIVPLVSPYNSHFEGEAVTVQLPGRGTLFALVKNVEMYPENLFGDLRRPRPGPPRFSDRVEDLRHIKKMVGASATLDCMNPPWIGVRCPTLVRFRDSNDPKTIEIVDPTNLAASFGTGVSVKSVTVQITNDPVTTGIDKALPWLNNLSRYRQDPDNPFTSTLSSEISHIRRVM